MTWKELTYPKTAEEWWHNVTVAKEELLNMLCSFHPGVNRCGKWTMPITASRAETVSEQIRAEIAIKSPNPRERFEQAFKDKNPIVMLALLNETWFGIPESLSCWDLPAFGVLCDLCSECDCVMPEEDETCDE